MSEETQRLADILAAALWVHGQYQGAYAGLAAVYPLIFEAGRQQGREEAAQLIETDNFIGDDRADRLAAAAIVRRQKEAENELAID